MSYSSNRHSVFLFLLCSKELLENAQFCSNRLLDRRTFNIKILRRTFLEMGGLEANDNSVISLCTISNQLCFNIYSNFIPSPKAFMSPSVGLCGWTFPEIRTPVSSAFVFAVESPFVSVFPVTTMLFSSSQTVS